MINTWFYAMRMFAVSGSREGPGASDKSWAGEVRALRDSHVRLVLRQLRQLRDIDRLDRALRRPPPSSPVSAPPPPS